MGFSVKVVWCLGRRPWERDRLLDIVLAEGIAKTYPFRLVVYEYAFNWRLLNIGGNLHGKAMGNHFPFNFYYSRFLQYVSKSCANSNPPNETLARFFMEKVRSLVTIN